MLITFYIHRVGAEVRASSRRYTSKAHRFLWSYCCRLKKTSILKHEDEHKLGIQGRVSCHTSVSNLRQNGGTLLVYSIRLMGNAEMMTRRRGLSLRTGHQHAAWKPPEGAWKPPECRVSAAWKPPEFRLNAAIMSPVHCPPNKHCSKNLQCPLPSNSNKSTTRNREKIYIHQWIYTRCPPNVLLLQNSTTLFLMIKSLFRVLYTTRVKRIQKFIGSL